LKVAAAFKTHSGWAAVVVVAAAGDRYDVIERRRIELVDPEDAGWAKAVYHAVEGRELAVAERVVAKGIAAVRSVARRELVQLVERLRGAGHEPAGCGVLVGAPMPRYSVEDVLAVHVRMHQAEGAMFVDALCDAVEHAGVPLVRVAARDAEHEAGSHTIAALGKRLGPPWAKDQRSAAVAALRVLGGA
jgi:hypothetical protein